VIRLTGRILAEACVPDFDFLGHIGGDDFIVLFRSADWQARAEAALACFGREIAGFFSPDDRERGGYVTENRRGEKEFHRLTSLSIGAVAVRPGMFVNHMELAKVAAETKHHAKRLPGNSLHVNHRQYPGDGLPADGPAPGG